MSPTTLPQATDAVTPIVDRYGVDLATLDAAWVHRLRNADPGEQFVLTVTEEDRAPAQARLTAERVSELHAWDHLSAQQRDEMLTRGFQWASEPEENPYGTVPEFRYTSLGIYELVAITADTSALTFSAQFRRVSEAVSA